MWCSYYSYVSGIYVHLFPLYVGRTQLLFDTLVPIPSSRTFQAILSLKEKRSHLKGCFTSSGISELRNGDTMLIHRSNFGRRKYFTGAGPLKERMM